MWSPATALSSVLCLTAFASCATPAVCQVLGFFCEEVPDPKMGDYGSNPVMFCRFDLVLRLCACGL